MGTGNESTAWERLLIPDSAEAEVIEMSETGEHRCALRRLALLRDRMLSEYSAELRPGRAIGIFADNGIAWIAAFAAVVHAGAVPVPISVKLPRPGVEFIVADADLHTVLADRPRIASLSEWGVSALPLLEPGDAEERGSGGAGGEAVRRPDDELGLILYTSGSTGQPKGVELGNRTLRWIVETVAPAVARPETRMLVVAPLNHIAALMFALSCVSQRGTLVVMPRFESRAFLGAVERHRVTDLTGVPPMFAMLVREHDLLGELDLSSVARVTMGSAPSSHEMLAEIESWFPGASVTTSYGTTESGPGVFGPHPDGLPTPLGSVGAARRVPRIRLVDSDGEPTSGRGVLEVRSPSMMMRYRNRPDLVPPVTSDGFHHTGDLFEVDDQGFFWFAGREDDVFKCGGETVYPQAVEEALEAHPAVLSAVVLPVPDALKGRKPVAFVLVSPGFEFDERALQQHVLGRLEPFAHPRRIWPLDAFPLAAANKVDRKRLAEAALLACAEERPGPPAATRRSGRAD